MSRPLERTLEIISDVRGRGEEIRARPIKVKLPHRHVSTRTRAIFPTYRDMSLGDWLFFAAIVAANVIPWGLFIWGLTL